jgi:hypothetical protein
MDIAYYGDEVRPFSGSQFYISLLASFVLIKGEWTYYNPNSIDILEITPDDYGDDETLILIRNCASAVPLPKRIKKAVFNRFLY